MVTLSRQHPIITGPAAHESNFCAALRTGTFFSAVALTNELNTFSVNFSVRAHQLTKAIQVEPKRREPGGRVAQVWRNDRPPPVIPRLATFAVSGMPPVRSVRDVPGLYRRQAGGRPFDPVQVTTRRRVVIPRAAQRSRLFSARLKSPSAKVPGLLFPQGGSPLL